jgi:hypothetical protein
MTTRKGAKDALGNELREGDIVAFWPQQHILGKVVKVVDSGLILGAAAPREAPTVVKVLIDVTLTCRPGMALPPLVKVENPQGDDLLNRIADENKSS